MSAFWAIVFFGLLFSISKATQFFGYTSTYERVKSYILHIFDKKGWVMYLWAIFFRNSSGHPAHRGPQDKR
jgi:hypothetical protein